MCHQNFPSPKSIFPGSWCHGCFCLKQPCAILIISSIKDEVPAHGVYLIKNGLHTVKQSSVSSSIEPAKNPETVEASSARRSRCGPRWPSSFLTSGFPSGSVAACNTHWPDWTLTNLTHSCGGCYIDHRVHKIVSRRTRVENMILPCALLKQLQPQLWGCFRFAMTFHACRMAASALFSTVLPPVLKTTLPWRVFLVSSDTPLHQKPVLSSGTPSQSLLPYLLACFPFSCVSVLPLTLHSSSFPQNFLSAFISYDLYLSGSASYFIWHNNLCF